MRLFSRKYLYRLWRGRYLRLFIVIVIVILIPNEHPVIRSQDVLRDFDCAAAAGHCGYLDIRLVKFAVRT